VLELTENGVIADPERGADVLTRLRELGAQLSLDDFGAGQTSLAHLRDLALREVKLDRSLVSGVARDRAAAAIVAAIVELSRTLGLRVVAEGAEDELTVHRLAALGCDLVQGYVLSRPLPADELPAWWAARAAAAAA